jgi:hypothetical protein
MSVSSIVQGLKHASAWLSERSRAISVRASESNLLLLVLLTTGIALWSVPAALVVAAVLWCSYEAIRRVIVSTVVEYERRGDIRTVALAKANGLTLSAPQQRNGDRQLETQLAVLAAQQQQEQSFQTVNFA